jgi:hypothetical protein
VRAASRLGTKLRAGITAGLVLCSLGLAGVGLAAGPGQADRTTIAGNSGTITLDWQATQDSKGRPLIVGHVITYGGMSGYCQPRLLVETLDAQGQVTAQRMGFIPGFVGGFDNVYFEEPIRAPGPAYRVSIVSWEKCGGGQ